MNILYDSLVYDRYAVCRYDDGTSFGPAEIRIRGYKSRMVPKKSFTLRYTDDNGEEIKVALDAGGDPWLSYNLAMYAYELAGLKGVPQLTPVGLYLNGRYLGYYNVIPLYSEHLQDSDFYGIPGELFKVFVTEFARDYPIQGQSEKKFPDDDDFSRFNRLLANAANMESEDWVPWIEANIHLEDMARYMAVRDFLGIDDTYNSNFYVYVDERYRILPWDNDHYYARTAFGGNNLLTRRMMESTVFVTEYDAVLDTHFAAASPTLLELENRMANLAALLDTAVENSPVFYLDYSDFVDEQQNISDFFTDRPGDIPDY